jgi:hypothetical protein
VVLPRALPCVHLGEFDRTAWGGQAGQSLLPSLFSCPHHGTCCPEGTLPPKSGVRACASCKDFIPRDPNGPSAQIMAARADAYLSALSDFPQSRYDGRGIVIAGGGEKYFASVYVSIRAIRHVGCQLPIELWYLGRNNELPPDREVILKPYGVKCIDADKVRIIHPAKSLDGWPLKAFSTLHSAFKEVLFLDADCYPCRLPDELFSCPEYVRLGAIFWPDTSGPDGRLKWPAFGVADPHTPCSVESGVYLIDKEKSWRPLNLAWFYNNESGYYYKYCYGDKHTFEVAWPATNQNYVMFRDRAVWDEVAYLHPGSNGEPMFVHRCCDKFRFAKHTYTTWQGGDVPRRIDRLPLESECWDFMEQLSTILRYGPLPVRKQEGRP